MAHWQKHLFWKLRDLSFSPQHPHRKMSCAWNPSTWGQRQVDLNSSASLTDMAKCRASSSVRDPVSGQLDRKGEWGHYALSCSDLCMYLHQVLRARIHTHTHTHTNTHTHTHTHTEREREREKERERKVSIVKKKENQPEYPSIGG
jgi:hypothetical protein